jgi:hypothetical protein
VAQEFIARAQSNNDTGKAQIDMARAAITELRGIVDAQYTTIISLTIELQQAHTSARTANDAYNAVADQQQQSSRGGTLLSIFGTLAALALVGILIAAIARRWRIPTVADRGGGDVGGAEIIDAE